MNGNFWDRICYSPSLRVDDSDFLDLLSKPISGQSTSTVAIPPPPALVSPQGVFPLVPEKSSPSPSMYKRLCSASSVHYGGSCILTPKPQDSVPGLKRKRTDAEESDAIRAKKLSPIQDYPFFCEFSSF
ncbi:hypothetical protein FRC02_004042 [Tulasnella sp. 418]|nr:hypothetical protein FRC02_004042 [Tulasnella sp. 418]